MSENPLSNQEKLERKLEELEPGNHLCCIYETDEEHRVVLTPFVRQGLRRGEKLFYIVDVRTADEILGYLCRDGLGVEEYLKQGQLKILSADESYAREGTFDPDGMIALLIDETERALAEGYSALRVTGEMTWALRGLPGADRLIEYETKLNDFFARHKCSAICQYDRRRFESGILLDVLTTHPLAIVGTRLLENFYYMPPQDLMGPDPQTARLNNWLQNLEMRQQTMRDLQNAHDDLDRRVRERTEELTESNRRLGLEIRERGRMESALVEHLRFERMVSDLSTRFVNLPVREIDREIASTLRRVVEFFGVDRGTLFRISEDQKHLQAVESYTTEAVDAMAEFRADELFPYLWPKFLGSGPFSFSSLDDLPEDAPVDRESFRKYGVKSNVSISFNVGGKPSYLLSLGASQHERNWDSGLIPRIQLVGEVLVNAITRKRSEEELRRTEIKYRTVADFTYDWAYWEDVDGTLLYVSPSCERISGYKPREFCENPSRFRDLILPEDKPAWDQHRGQSFETSRRGEVQVRIRTRDGGVKWIEHGCQPVTGPDGAFLGLRASNRDVTDRKLAEEKARQRERSLAEAQRIAHLGSWDWDIVRNELSWSDEVYRIFGLEPQGFGATYEAFLGSVHPLDRETVTEAVNRALADPEQKYSVEHRVVLPDRSVRLVHERGEVQFDETGNPIRMIGTVHDITELRAMEAESRRLRNQLAHLDRVGTVGALTSAIAHETNQPLAAILSNAQAALRLLGKQEPDLDEVREALEDIVRDDKRADKVIRGLRALLKKEERLREPFDLNAVIGEVLHLVHSEIVMRNVSVTTALDSEIPIIAGDPIQIQQVILNLLMNALDAMKGQPEDARRVFVSTRMERDGGATVTITDSGPGVEPEKIEDVFEPFYTSKTHGMGLGLSVCRSIVEAHGGRLWAETDSHEGGSFSFWLPFAPPHR